MPASAKTSTPDRILDVAEPCSAEHGYKAVSLRSILRECGANIAAAHYHFGSKHDCSKRSSHAAARA